MPTAQLHGIYLMVIAVLALALVAMGRSLLREATERRRERRMREEMEAYGKLNPALKLSGVGTDEITEAPRRLAWQVCRLVAQKSVFHRVGMLLRDAEGKLFCAASAGMDDLTVGALGRWAQQVAEEERGGDPVRSLTTGMGRAFGSVQVGRHSFALQLGEWEEFDAELSEWKREGKRERRRYRRAVATPLRMQSGRILGVLVVCGEMSRVDRPMGIERALMPIEALALRVANAIESAEMADRLLRAEKLAALGKLAAGVAHALNNPLTAVLGFGEHIAENALEAGIRKDAGTIVSEALKMRDTVQRLIEFWRPTKLGQEPVELEPLVWELAQLCTATLEARGVRLIVTAGEAAPQVRGSRKRLRQVLEHLLNNAAQAISTARAPENGEPHTIRMTLSHDERGVQVIVSDTGEGFKEPGQVFDPFYTTQEAGGGVGLGLSTCYGIVREHGGEINAFNLHPHGAAVVIELPVRGVVMSDEMGRILVREVA
jgi:signal transduction histidine kinase